MLLGQLSETSIIEQFMKDYMAKLYHLHSEHQLSSIPIFNGISCVHLPCEYRYGVLIRLNITAIFLIYYHNFMRADRQSN